MRVIGPSNPLRLISTTTLVIISAFFEFSEDIDKNRGRDVLLFFFDGDRQEKNRVELVKGMEKTDEDDVCEDQDHPNQT